MSTGAPPSIGGTTAAFTGSVNPSGLPTTASFQYGLDPKYTGGGPVTYTQSTPAQSVGSDFTSHTVTASVTGLVPNATYHVRLVATNSAGTTFGPDVVFNTLRTPPPGAPALGKTFNVSVVSGVVLIEDPRRVHSDHRASADPRQHGDQRPARHAQPDHRPTRGAGPRRGRQGQEEEGQDAVGDVRRRDLQDHPGHQGRRKGAGHARARRGRVQGRPDATPRARRHKAGDATAAALSSKTLQLLHASAKGKFATKGKYSAATVRGTKWTIADRCDGTLTHDITHSVAVSDFVRHKTIILHAGQSYLAKAPKHK